MLCRRGSKHPGAFHDFPGLFQTCRVAGRIRESVSAQIGADRGEDKSVPVRKIPDRFQLLRRIVQHVQIVADGVNLNPFRAQFPGPGNALFQRTLQ